MTIFSQALILSNIRVGFFSCMHVEAASQPWVLFVMNCSPYILIESSTAEVEVGETFYTQSESPDKNT